MLRVGDHYFFQIADKMINSSESLSIERVEYIIAGYSTHTSVEKANQKLSTLKNNQHQQTSILNFPKNRKVSSAPVKVVPLQQKKSRSEIKNDDTNQIATNGKNFKKIVDMRHTFCTAVWITEDELKLFAAQNGFTSSDPVATKVSITAAWQDRGMSSTNFKISTDSFGVMQDIHHRKVRWLSTTFKRYEKTGSDDVRVYLETIQELDDVDEKRLLTLQQYLDNRSILNPDMVALINQNDPNNDKFFSITMPLIREMMNLNWKINVIRVVKCKLSFVNNDGDVVLLNEVRDGHFDTDGKFKWMGMHNELEGEINMANRSNEKICRDSYDMSLKLFEFIK